MDIGAAVIPTKGLTIPGVAKGELGTVEFISGDIALIAFKNVSCKMRLDQFEEYNPTSEGPSLERFDEAVRTVLDPEFLAEGFAQDPEAMHQYVLMANIFAVDLRNELFKEEIDDC